MKLQGRLPTPSQDVEIRQADVKMPARSAMRCFILLLSTAFLWSVPASAKHWHDNHDHWRKHSHKDDDDSFFDHNTGGCHFQPYETRVISGYYAPQFRNLPPGLQKKLSRGGHLPPAWQRRVEPLPIVVERQLAPVPAKYRRGYVDGQVVMYNPHTRVVIDVFAVFGPR